MSYEGSCHCRAVAFRVEGELPTSARSCNCSHCGRKGLLLAFAPADVLSITSGEERLVTYQFGKHTIEHLFCPICACQPFGFGTMADGSRMVGINLRCVEGIDIASLEIIEVDGASI